MQLKVKGVVLALKNLGTFLAGWTASGIQADPAQFALNLTMFLLISTPTDLLLLNHLSKAEAAKQ